MPQLTAWEQDKYVELQDTTDDDTKAQLEAAKELWEADQNMFVTSVVNAPYDGCFYEPNIHLVDIKTVNDELVLPLYASGQGLGTDVVGNFGELCWWIASGSLMGVMAQDGRTSARCSKHNMLSPYGTFDSFEVKPATTKLNDLAPAEHYWATAARNADSEWGLPLTWHCGKCNQDITGGEYECEPVFTSYRGNGGVGVFMEGAICQECAEQGMCEICKQDGDYHNSYDTDVAEHGWHLCEWHTEEHFKNCVKAADDIELPTTVSLRRLTTPDQRHLPGIEGDNPLVFVDEKDRLLPIQLMDRDTLVHNLRYMDEVEWHLDEKEYGLQLSGAGLQHACNK